jgi:hypothetical protein
MLGAKGDTIYVRNEHYVPTLLPRKPVDSVLTRLKRVVAGRGNASSGPLPPAIAKLIDGLPVPRTYAPVSTVVVAPDGALLIGGTTNAATTSWKLFSPTGSPVGTFTLPVSVTLLALRGDTAWGTDTNADGVPSIVRYRLGGK